MGWRGRALVLLAASGFFGAGAIGLWAQETTKATKPASKKTTKPAVAKTDELPALTPERETVALGFVQTHHPELADVLDRLKDMNRGRYEKALSELFRTSESLSLMQSRDPKRYELTLKAWKVKSRIELVSARLANSRDPQLQARLKELLQEQLDLELEQHRLERERLQTRLEKVDGLIRRFESDRHNVVESRYRRWLNFRENRKRAESTRRETK
jgi:hypothetical protein